MNTIPDTDGEMGFPKIIQGGMGVNVSSPELANTVSSMSQPGRETLGTISGTAVERVMARMLQRGGPEAQKIIAALADFPFPEVSEKVTKKYFNRPGVGIPVFTLEPSRALIELVVCANYAFVKMAKKGHKNPVSINYLEKIQMPHLASIYGAMLADVDYVTMGAGIPIYIPPVFQAFAKRETASYKISVIGAKKDDIHKMTFNPEDYFESEIPEVNIPKFLPIISTHSLAKIINDKIEGLFAGFIIEDPIAGGHNAPPRGGAENYGERDKVNFQTMREIGIPYWLAGGYASPEGLARALSLGAVGIQAGSIFALSRESGMRPDIRERIVKIGAQGTVVVRTDKDASPTGFPFKVAEIPGTISEGIIYRTRTRVCDECALRSPYVAQQGNIDYRCSSEPGEEEYVRKGGKIEDTIGKICLCNGLMATAGVNNDTEPPLVTLGDDLTFISKLAPSGKPYSSHDALNYIFGMK